MGVEGAVKLSVSQPLDLRIERLKPYVQAYLKQLRFHDPGLIETLALECLYRASRRGTQDEQKLLRRALEEVQRHLDNALAQAFGWRLPEDMALVSAARAALLLTCQPARADDLFRASPEREALLARLKLHLPQATPPETVSSMPTHPLEFWI